MRARSGMGLVVILQHEMHSIQYPDLSCATLLLIHIFDANVFFAIVSCCSHIVGVLVPVLFPESVLKSLSRSLMMTVLTNALSIADMLSS
jgi:hypothetical protein